VRLDRDKVGRLCRRRGLTVDRLLCAAGVSRNAYYTLARKSSVVPGTVRRIAATLGVGAGALLTRTDSPAGKAQELMRRVEAVVKKHRGTDPENVRHTLLLLQKKKPIDRLRGALRRGRKTQSGTHLPD